jgi:hypothetical protein
MRRVFAAPRRCMCSRELGRIQPWPGIPVSRPAAAASNGGEWMKAIREQPGFATRIAYRHVQQAGQRLPDRYLIPVFSRLAWHKDRVPT